MLTGIHFFATSCLGLGETETPIIVDKMIIKDCQNFYICIYLRGTIAKRCMLFINIANILWR